MDYLEFYFIFKKWIARDIKFRCAKVFQPQWRWSQLRCQQYRESRSREAVSRFCAYSSYFSNSEVAAWVLLCQDQS
eukprot:SAG31_NODE_1774_length_7303_cov_4.685453_3_plen_76_part_00